MAATPLEILLNDLGRSLNIPNLAPDENNTCLLKIEGKIDVQIEIDKNSDYLLFGSEIGQIPPGRYRENLFEAALKADSQPSPLIGILGYSKKSDKLTMHHRLLISDSNSDTIAEHLRKFATKAILWKEALEKGEIPFIEEVVPSQKIGFFGLRP